MKQKVKQKVTYLPFYFSKKRTRYGQEKHKSIMELYIYQFIAKLNGSILIASLFARATPTEDTNPLEL